LLKILGIKSGLFEVKWAEIKINIILPIIGFTGIIAEFFSQVLPKLVLLKYVGLYAIIYKF
jgi:hypothetical protein